MCHGIPSRRAGGPSAGLALRDACTLAPRPLRRCASVETMAGQRQDADRPRLADACWWPKARSGPERGLRRPAGRSLSRLGFDTGAICPVPGLFSSSLVCHTELELRTSRPRTGLLLTLEPRLGQVAAGFTLGFWRGLAAVYPAAVLGAVLSFAAGRRLGARWRAYIPTKVASLWVRVRSPPRHVRPYFRPRWRPSARRSATEASLLLALPLPLTLTRWRRSARLLVTEASLCYCCCDSPRSLCAPRPLSSGAPAIKLPRGHASSNRTRLGLGLGLGLGFRV